jgi:hypothetical protein
MTMRNINVLTFVSLDGVMQGPGAPEEDTSGGFRHGGWSVGYFDDAVGREMGRQMGQKYDLLLGRRTYDIFASHWPRVTELGADMGINTAHKYGPMNAIQKAGTSFVEQFPALEPVVLWAVA